jgi:hypothetical protein
MCSNFPLGDRCVNFIKYPVMDSAYLREISARARMAVELAEP